MSRTTTKLERAKEQEFSSQDVLSQEGNSTIILITRSKGDSVPLPPSNSFLNMFMTITQQLSTTAKKASPYTMLLLTQGGPTEMQHLSSLSLNRDSKTCICVVTHIIYNRLSIFMFVKSANNKNEDGPSI